MAANYLELSVLFLKELQNRQEMEQACSRLVTQFAQGFIDEFKWPASQIDFLPMEGNLKELPKGLGVQNGPGQALRYVDGAYQVGLTVLILAQPPGQPSPQDGSGVRFIRIRTPITLRVGETHIDFTVGDREHLVHPANAAADLQPVYAGYFEDMSDYLTSLGEGQKPSKFGFHHVDD
jgi:hypothetical protein